MLWFFVGFLIIIPIYFYIILFRKQTFLIISRIELKYHQMCRKEEGWGFK